MADLHLVKTLEDNKYTLTVYVDNVSDAEAAMVTKFGEPRVSFGGTVDVGVASNFTIGYTPETDAAFTIPVQTAKKIISGFTVSVPYSIYMDGDVNSAIQVASSKPLAEAIINDLASHIERKFSDSWTAFDALVDNFTSSDTVIL